MDRPTRALPNLLQGGVAPHLRAAETFSTEVLARLRDTLMGHMEQLDGIETIAVAGSLARFEASPLSDIDCLIIVRDGCPPSETEKQRALIISLLAASELKLPKSTGIFGRAIAPATLLDRSALGSLDETPAIFGTRIQFLLDVQPLFRNDRCASLQNDILHWYGSGFQQRRAGASWTHLINDVMRYVHSYAVWQQYKFERSDDDSWQLRQAKLRSSRMMTFAGLIVLLGQSNRLADKQHWLLGRLSDTPLERVGRVMSLADADAWQRLLSAYDRIHGRMQDEQFRTALIVGGPGQLADLVNEYSPEFEEIRSLSDVVLDELSTFILARQEEWGTRFYSRLLL
jgi:hypothetical protein